MEVKGTLLIDYVRVLRSAKDKDWSKWLNQEDLDIINSQILPSQWYPYKTMERIGQAIFRELADSDLNTVRTFGKFMAGNLVQVYKNVLVEGDPAASAVKIINIQQMFFRGLEQQSRIIARGEKSLTFGSTVESSVSSPEAAEAVVYQTAGVLEGIIELAGGTNVKTKIIKTGDSFELILEWE